MCNNPTAKQTKPKTKNQPKTQTKKNRHAKKPTSKEEKMNFD
jgi:hypothetical protein